MPQSSNQCFCSDECRRQGAREQRREYDRAARSLRNDEFAKEKRDKSTKRRKPAISLQEAARLANNAHMTYGKYVLTHKI